METENRQVRPLLKKALCIFMTVLMLMSSFSGAISVFATEIQSAPETQSAPKEENSEFVIDSITEDGDEKSFEKETDTFFVEDEITNDGPEIVIENKPATDLPDDAGDDNSEIIFEPGKTTTVTLADYEQRSVYFTPAKTGTYKFYGEATSAVRIIVYDEEDNYVDAAVLQVQNITPSFFQLEGGKKYRLQIVSVWDMALTANIAAECLAAECDHESTTKHDALEPDCKNGTDGYTASEQCDICSMWLESRRTVPAMHTDENTDLVCDRADCRASISVVKQGYCGSEYVWNSSYESYRTENASFTLYDTGLLVIEGEGRIGLNQQEEFPHPEFAELFRDECVDCSTPYVDDYFIKKIIIKEGITVIGDDLFKNLHALTEISLPSSLRSICNCAFMNCEKLTDVFIPENVTSVDPRAFERCTSIEKFTVAEENPYIHSDEYGVIYCPEGGESNKLNICAFPAGSSMISYTIPENVAYAYLYSNLPVTLRELTVLNLDTSIEIWDCKYLKTVKGYSYSTAYAYAKNNGIEFTSLDNKEVESIAINTYPDRLRFRLNDWPEHYGLSISVNFTDGTNRILESGFDVSEIDTSTIGEKEVTVTVGDYTTTYTVEVYEYTAPELKTSKTTTISMENSRWHGMYFTPAKTGSYRFDSNATHADVFINEAHGPDYVCIASGVVYGDSSLYTDLQGGQRYYIEVYNCCDRDDTLTITPECIAADCDHADTTYKEAKEVTCTEDGYTESEQCNICSMWLKKKTVITAGHIDEDMDFVCDREGCGNEISVVKEGYCGNTWYYDEEMGDEYYTTENACFKLYTTGLLVIEGEGEIGIYDPWADDCFPEFAETEEHEDGWRYVNDNFIKKIIIGEGIKHIDQKLFRNLHALTEIVLPESLRSIYGSAFENCNKLTSIHIPSNVTYIASSAFEGCTSIEKFTVAEDSAYYYSDEQGVLYSKNNGYEPDELHLDLSLFPRVSKITSYTFPENVTYIYGNGGYVPRTLKELTFLNPEVELNTMDIGQVSTIRGYSLSTAEQFAKNYDVSFISLDESEVDEVVINSLPEKTNFRTNANFSYNGLTLKVKFADGTSRIITKDFSFRITEPDMSTPGEKDVTVTIGDYTLSYTINVYEYVPPVLTLDTKTEIPVDAWMNYGMYFTPAVDGIYSFAMSTTVNDEISIRYIDSALTEVEDWENIYEWENYNWFYRNDTWTVELKGGVKYWINTYVYGDGSFSITPECIYGDCDHESTTVTEGKQATCTENGYTASEKCNICSMWLEKSRTIKSSHIDENNDLICDRAECKASISVIKEGYCGAQYNWDSSNESYETENARFTLYDTGVLVIEGTGTIGINEYSDTNYPLFAEIEENPDDCYDCYNYYVNDNFIRKIIIKEGITEIGGRLFANLHALEEVELPSTLRTIRYYAFESCESLKEVFIPNSVTEIAGSAFVNCDSIEKFTVEEGSRYYYSDEYGVVYHNEWESYDDNCCVVETIVARRLLLFPIGSKMTSYTVAENVAEFSSDDFKLLRLRELTFLNPEVFIDLDYYPNLKTIYGYSFSTASEAANRYGAEFVSIDSSEIESVEFESLPYKTRFRKGSYLNTDGLRIRINFADGSSRITNNNLRLEYDFSVGEQEVTVFVGDFTLSYTITVYEYIAPELTVGERTEIKLDYEDYHNMYFTPAKTGTYKFNMHSSYDVEFLGREAYDDCDDDCYDDCYDDDCNDDWYNDCYDDCYDDCSDWSLRRSYDDCYDCDDYNNCDDCNDWDDCYDCDDDCNNDWNDSWNDEWYYSSYFRGSKTVTADLKGGVRYLLRVYSNKQDSTFSITPQCVWAECDHMDTTDYDAVEATCAQPGYTAGTRCNECTLWIEGHEKVTTPHTDEDSDGICDVCENTLSDISPDNPLEIEVNEGETVKLKFVPEEPGYYTFWSSQTWEDTYGYIYDAEDSVIDYDDDGYTDSNFAICTYLYAGEVYYLGARYYSPNISGSFTVTISYGTKDEVLGGNDCDDDYDDDYDDDDDDDYDDYYDTVYENGFEAIIDSTGGCHITNMEVAIGNAYANGGHLEIPATIEGHTVRFVDFLNDNGVIKSISFPATVEFIHTSAFNDLFYENLESITVDPDNQYYKSVDGVLYNYDLTNVLVVPRAYKGTLTLPDSITDISSESLTFNGNITNIEFSENADLYYDGYVLYNKDQTIAIKGINLKGDYVMPETVEEIGRGAFADLDELRSVKISSKVTEITYSAFLDSDALESVELPANLERIGWTAFESCDSLKTIELNEGLTSIGYRAFNKSGLESVSLPSTLVDGMESMVFANCKNLTSVNLGTGLTVVGDYAFAKCTALEEISFPVNVTTIDESAFSGSGLKTLTIPDNIIMVKYHGFSDCDSLKSVVIGDGTESLRAAFVGCDNLETVHLGKNITDMEYCFSGCRSLKKIDATKGLTTISGDAFENCSSLSEVYLPDTVQEIVYGAFNNCTSLDEFDLPDNLVSLGGHSLDNTEWFNSLDDGEAYIQQALYTYKGSIPEDYTLIVQDGTTLIAGYAFEDETDLKHVDLPDGFEYIGNFSFYNTGIEDIIIPDSLKKINWGAFERAYSLDNVYYTGTEEQWNEIEIEDGNEPLLNATIKFNYVRCTHPNTETVPATAISCNVLGYTEGVRCLDCGRYISGHKAVKDKHKDENYDGKCDVCSEKATEYENGISVYVKRGEKVYIRYFAEASGGHYIHSRSWGGVKLSLYDNQYNLLQTDICSPGEYTLTTNYNLEKFKVYYITLEHANASLKGNIDLDIYRYATDLNEGDYTYRISGNYAAISQYNGNDKELTVPSTLGGRNVEWIDGRAFENKLTETLVLPETVTGLSYSAFYNNYKLEEVYLPSVLETIRSSAFDNCHSIKDVYYNGTTEQFKDVRIEFNNEAITNATIHCTDGIFETTFTVGDFEYRVDFMENQATAIVSGYKGEGGDVVIPEEVNGYTVASIDENVFPENDTVTSVTIPKTVNLIHGGFDGCKNLERIYITDLAQWCTLRFYSFAFKNVNLYLNGESLTNAIIPDGVDYIRCDAFAGCMNITNVEIPESVTYIGEGAFENCPNLETIQYRGTEERWYNEGLYENIPYGIEIIFESGHAHDVVTEAGIEPGCVTEGYGESIKCSICNKVFAEPEILPATGHTFTEEVTEATCTQAGIKTFTCDCGHSYTEFIEDAKDHDYGEWEIVKEATNTEDGQWKRICANDSEHVEYLTIPKGGHEFDTENPVITVAPGCETTGIATYKCITEGHDGCGVEMTVTLPEAGHKGNVIHTAPGCMTPGRTEIFCPVCETTIESTEIPALGYHNFNGEGEVTVEATCTAEGLMTYTCLEEGCEETHTEPIAKAEHTLLTNVTEATCSAEGKVVTECIAEGCDYEIVSVIEKTPHTITTSYKAPTCTEGAYISEKCDICGNETKNPIAEIGRLGHSYTKLIEKISDATCTEDGEKICQCSRCDETATVPIYATGHSYSITKLIEATCTEASRKEYSCSCGKLGFVEFIENAKGHAYGEWEVVKQPTVTEDGQWKRTCANDPEHIEYVTVPGCGHTFDINTFEITVEPTCTTAGTAVYKCQTEGHTCGVEVTVTLPATGHNGEIVYTAPGCETPGRTEIYCSTCKTTVVSEEIPAIGHHNFSGEGKITVEATCTQEGVMSYTCLADGCEETRTESIAKADHNLSTTVTEATCMAEGSVVTKCTAEGCELEFVSTLEKKPHTISGAYTYPTCETNGYLTEKCTAEGCTYEEITSTDADAALGHSYTVDVEITKPATCLEKGEKTVRCSRCDATSTTEIPAIGHNYQAEGEVKETCTESGYIPFSCKNEGCTSIYKTLTSNPKGHKEAKATEENRTESTCTVAGSYDSVIYCSDCNAELSRKEVALELAAHTPDEAVEEKRTESTCAAEGSYDSVVYCSVCDAELSRETVILNLEAHTPAKTVKENETTSTCTKAGSYDSVVYCSACDAELSREKITLELAAHTPAEAVKENETASTCTKAGSYDSVVYCSICDAELSRETIALELAAHTPDEAVEEKRTESTCAAEGSYDSVVYCSACDAELSRETITLELATHTPEAVVENMTESTCAAEGSYDSVVYCSACDKELSRKTVALKLAAHKPGKAATCTTAQKCTECDKELADALGHSWSKSYTVDKAATYKAPGSKSKHCTRSGCTAKTSVTTIAMLTLSKVSGLKATQTDTTLTLSWTKVKGAEKYEVSYSTDGKKWTKVSASKNSATVKGLKSGTTYKVKVRAVAESNTGSYSSVLTTATKPAKATLSSVKSSKAKQVTVNWKTVSGASGYEIQYSTSSKFKSAKSAKISKGSSKKTTLKKLTSGKKYYFRIRAYKTVDGTPIYGAWSSSKNLKVK